MSPISGEHSCSLNPGEYESYARKNAEQKSDGRDIDVIYGIDKKGKSKIASLRYSTEIWDQGEAELHCKHREGTFEPAEPEIKLEPKLKETRNYFFASPVSLAQDEHTVDIEILREGSWAMKKAPGGVLELTKAKLAEFIKNFQDQVVGQELPLDIEHEGPTVGWIRKMWINTKDGLAHLWARLDVTDPETQDRVKEGSLRYFSPSLEINYRDPETKEYYDLIRSGALTNWPFIKRMQPAIVNFSEVRELEQDTESRRKAEVLLAKENEITTLKEASRVVTQQLIKTNKQMKVKDQVILKLQAKTKIDRLADTGALSPFEAQKCREIALSEPAAVDLAIELLAGRGPAVTLGSSQL